MLSDRKLGSGAVEASLTCENIFRGGDVRAFYCRDCGFIESEGIESWSAVTTEGLSERALREEESKEESHEHRD
jgi:hypothetical protein